jgi:hypothetical protein
LDFRGEFYHHTLMTPTFNPGPNPFGPPPIYVGALGPRLTRAVAEAADGLLVMPFGSTKFLHEATMPAVREGLAARADSAARSEFAVVPEVIVSAGDDHEATRRLLAFYGSTPAYRPVLDIHGWGDLQPELHALTKQGRWAEMGGLITDEVLHTMAKYENICKYIHLPIQSGNSRVLDIMNRTYTREWYLERVDAIRRILPQAAISTDIIVGFCTETEAEHQDTLSLMAEVNFSFAYMYMYSERPGTLAAKRFSDDIPEDVKNRRLNEIIEQQHRSSHKRVLEQLGKVQKVLIESFSKKSDKDYAGRSDQNTTVIFPVDERFKPGDYVHVLAESCTTATLIGKIID